MKVKDEKKIRIATVVFTCLVVVIYCVLMYSDELDAEEFNDAAMRRIDMSLSLGDKVKEYFNFHSLVNSNTLMEWNLDKEIAVDSNVYYLNGTYKCSDQSSSCVYQEAQAYPTADGKYPFEIYVYLNDTNDIKMISSSYDADDDTDVIKAIRTYYEENNLVDYQNIIKWDMNSEKLVANEGEKVYLVEGKYRCIDDKQTCLSLQNNAATSVDGTSIFKVYATFVDNGTSLNLVGVSNNYHY